MPCTRFQTAKAVILSSERRERPSKDEGRCYNRAGARRALWFDGRSLRALLTMRRSRKDGRT